MRFAKGARLCREERRRRILKAAERQFAVTGLGSTSTADLAREAGISEALLYTHFGAKQTIFEEVVEQNVRDRLAVLRKRLSAIPNTPPIELIASMAEATILACVEANAVLMGWALMEAPEFAMDAYRNEIGATESLWDAEIATRLGDSPVRSRLSVHVVPYAAHACMAFGLWLVTLRHKPATAEAHARQYAEGLVNVARAALAAPPESLYTPASRTLLSVGERT